MSLFNFKKKKPCCSCNTSAKKIVVKECCNKPTEKICCIKVLGAGCKSCHQQFEYTKEAVSNLGLSIDVEYITDMAKIMEYGVMSMPAIVVNEKVVSMGKVLKVSEVEKLLHKQGF